MFDEFELQQRLIEERICPRLCGPMELEDENTLRCPACEYRFTSSIPLDQRKSLLSESED